jgi:sulfate adenylyltransferase large subunit
MTARPDPTGFALDDFLLQQEGRSLLRLVVCGSVDHGKSTFIGRLLYEGGLLFDDQLDALEADSRRHGTQGDDRDFALVLDGLAAEREQKITIDVAYRFFTTKRRKFIVADVPGHEQYTRNMATGASTADLALLLVSAREGITPQTKRHALIVSTLGVRHIVVAVNKMDLVGWQRAAFASLEAELRTFAEDLGVDELAFIPIAARSGDNIVTRSDRLRWYQGPALLDYLERVEVASPQQRSAFRLPVQWVNRPNANFRGYSGLITGGEVHPGMPVQILPCGQRTRIERIVTADGDLDHAFAGQAVTVTLADEVDASRGEVIAAIGPSAPVTNRLASRLVWMGREAMVPGRRYVLKLATCSTTALVEPDLRVVDLDTRDTLATDRLVTNDIGIGVLQLDRQVAADRYADQKDTGGFILIDPDSYDTVGMGIVEGTFQEEPSWSSRKAPLEVGATETKARSLAKAIGWRAVGGLGTFVLAGLATGSLKLAGGLVLAEILIKIVFNYLHERLWTAISWGRR